MLVFFGFALNSGFSNKLISVVKSTNGYFAEFHNDEKHLYVRFDNYVTKTWKSRVIPE